MVCDKVFVEWSKGELEAQRSSCVVYEVSESDRELLGVVWVVRMKCLECGCLTEVKITDKVWNGDGAYNMPCHCGSMELRAVS